MTYDSANGMFYGTTSGGGTTSNGTLFKFSPQTHAETVVHSFQGQPGDGAEPYAALIYDPASGTFYGMTTEGGANNDGTVFKFNPQTNAVTVVYSFGGPSGDGENPEEGALTYDPANKMLYGTTLYGGAKGNGTLFKFNPQTNTETVVYSFESVSGDGGQPKTALTYDSTSGMLYGTTSGGGAKGRGTLFKFDPKTHTETVLHSFTGYPGDGSGPHGGLTYDPANKMFYGTTYNGGTPSTYASKNSGGGLGASIGALFKFDPQTHAVTVVYYFGSVVMDGENPQGHMAYDAANGMFYGTTYRGGADSQGTVFEFNPKTNTETAVHSFKGDPGDGEQPEEALAYDPANGMFYGTTSGGGAKGHGTLFEFKP